jgi:hypothetical protein
VAASIRTDMVGAKEAVRSLNKIEPGLRKQFASDATQIAQPAIQEAQRRYDFVGWGISRVQGVSRTWAGPAVGGRKVLPFNLNKAKNGLKVKVEGDRRKTAVILLEQRDAGTAILESAGRANRNDLGDALGPLLPGRTRVLGPALYSKQSEVSEAMQKAVLEVIDRVNKELR